MTNFVLHQINSINFYFFFKLKTTTVLGSDTQTKVQLKCGHLSGNNILLQEPKYNTNLINISALTTKNTNKMNKINVNNITGEIEHLNSSSLKFTNSPCNCWSDLKI